MRALVYGLVGGILGWLVGIFMVVSRALELGPEAEAMVAMMAPTAPDTLLCTAVGALLGLVVGLIATRGK